MHEIGQNVPVSEARKTRELRHSLPHPVGMNILVGDARKANELRRENQLARRAVNSVMSERLAERRTPIATNGHLTNGHSTPESLARTQRLELVSR